MATPVGRDQYGPGLGPGHRQDLTTILEHLTPRQRSQLSAWQAELERASGWSTGLPVVVLDRCWLRLRALAVIDLPSKLPPDASAEAPELVHYRQLLAMGIDSWEAEQRCWLEFGSEAWQQALRRLWQHMDSPVRGWTLGEYLELLTAYRRGVETAGPRRLPLLVLARAGSRESHQLFWLHGNCRTMRHTCA